MLWIDTGGVPTMYGTTPIPGAFLAKYDASGGLVWVADAGGTTAEVNAVAVDAAGNAVVGGTFLTSATFGATVLHAPSSNRAAFVASFDPTGKALWATAIGGDSVLGLAIDASGNVWAAGSYTGATVIGTTMLLSHGIVSDGFVAKITSAGVAQSAVAFDADNQYCSIRGSEARAVAIAADGTLLVTGAFCGNVTLGTTTLHTSDEGGTSIVLGKLDPATTWKWAIGGGGGPDVYNEGLSIAPLNDGGLILGMSLGEGYPMAPGSTIGGLSIPTGGCGVARFDANGAGTWVKADPNGTICAGAGVAADPATGAAFASGSAGFTLGVPGPPECAAITQDGITVDVAVRSAWVGALGATPGTSTSGQSVTVIDCSTIQVGGSSSSSSSGSSSSASSSSGGAGGEGGRAPAGSSHAATSGAGGAAGESSSSGGGAAAPGDSFRACSAAPSSVHDRRIGWALVLGIAAAFARRRRRA